MPKNRYYATNLGIVNPEEYSFEHDVTEASDAKVEKKKKGDKPAAEKWLNPDKTFREQGLSELDTVVLKKKFFFSDQNVDRSDPVQLVLMYNQARDMIVSGKHPCTLEEAAQFGGIQLQVEVGNHEQDKHKSGFIKLKTFAPPEYLKSKDLEKKIYAEHRKLQGTTDLNAKFRYVQLIRSMKTYGVSFFFVKEPATKEKRKCSVLLGITKQSVVRMDTISKDVLQEWKLTQIRRWAATPKGFTLDFGEYADKYYNVETEEGEQISRLISGYIDIIIKKRNQLSIAPDSSLQEQAIVEDYVSPGQAQNISMYNGEHAQQSDGRANNFAAQQSREIEYSTNGELPVDLELMQALEYLKAKLQAALGVLSACNRDMYTATHLTYLGPDSQAKKWKTETREINSAAAASYITAEIAALSSLLISCTGETKDMDFDAIDSYISSIVSSISQVTGSWRILAGLLPDEESQNLLVMGQNLVESTAEFLTGIEGTISNQESSTVLHHVGTEVSNIAANALLAIGELDVTQDEQQLLIDAASNVINGISDVVAAADEIIKSLADDARMDAFNQDIEVALQVAPILETSASMLAIAIKTPLCRERLIEIAILVRDVLTAIESHEIEDRSDELLHNFKQGIQECEEALAFLVEKARNIENDIDYDIEAHYDQVVGVVDDLIKWLDEPKKATAYGKELVVNSTRLVEVFKMKIDSLEAGEEQESLAKDLESLSETILAMVQAIRSIKDFVNQDSATFVDSVNDLRDLTMLISEPYLKANTAKKLINALKSTLSASNQVVSAAKNVAPSNRDQASQLQLYKAGKEVTDKLPGLLKLIRETRANPREFVNRYKLLMGCKSFCSPAMALLSTAKSASSTTVEAGYQVQLLGAAQHLAEEIIYLQRLCNQMEAIMSEEDFTCANQSIKEIQENIRSISILGAENPQIVSADDNIDIGVQSQKLRSAIHELASSIQKGTFQAPHLDLVKFIAEYRAILSPLYAAILACDEATREILIQNANDLGDAVTLLIENQKDDKIIKTSITSADNAIRLILAHQPDQQSISIAQQAIHRLACNLKAGRASQKSDRSERPERLIWVAATKLLTISNSFVDACGDERGYQDLGKGVETFVNCFENMVDAVGIVSAKSSSTEMKATSENVTKLGENCNEFLGAINSTLSDSQSAAAKLNLFASMAKIQEVVDSILDSLSMSLPGQKQLEKASDLFKSMNLAISSNISESPAPDTSLAENFGKVSQHSHTMAQNLASVKNSINEGNPEAMATAVLQLVGSLQAVIQASSNTNQLIASHDTNVKPGVVGLDSAPYVASIDKIKNAMTAVLIPEQKQSKLLQDVSVIAAESARIRNMIKQAINGSDVSDAKKESLNAALASLISAIPPYVNSLKALTANSNDATVAACKAAGSPLLSVMDQISAELNPLPILSVETISKCTAVHQASKTLVDQGRAIHMAVQNLCAISDDKSLRDILIHEVEQLGRINLAFVNVVKETVPGQKQCENAQSQILSSQKLIAEARIGLASGSSSVNSSPDDLQSLKSGIEILANLMSLMKRNVRSELSTTLEAVAQVPIVLEQVQYFNCR